MDKVSAETRSRIMSRIRGRDTGPEIQIRSGLFARGFRFRIDCAELPGRPDLKLPKYGALVLVHGCFWHGHHCSFYRPPASNTGFWSAKIDRNRERDLRDFAALRGLGWRVCVVWECALRGDPSGRSREAVIAAIEGWIRGRRPFLELFDAEAAGAARAGAGVPRRRAAGIARNSDAALFAAERAAPYGRPDSG